MDKWLSGIIITAAVVLAGMGLLFSIGIVVEKAVAPVSGSLTEISSVQKEMRKKLDDSTSANMKSILDRLDMLEKRVKVLETVAAPAAPAAAPQKERVRPSRDTVHQIPAGTSAILGKADAPVTIVVFNDFECPYCSRFYPAVMEAMKAYPNKVNFVLKHFPLSFHAKARPAAKAALAAGAQGKFYEMTDLLFQNNKALSEEKFKELAGQLKLKVDQFMKDYKSRDAEWEKQIQADMDLGGKIGVQGTPSFFLNGKAVSPGAPEQWKAMIDEALKAKPAQK